MNPKHAVTEHDLEAYIDEALAADDSAAIERALRKRPELLEKLTEINARRNRGIHSLGDIWRRHRLGCPTREQIGSYLLGILDDEQARYVRIHVEVVGCRLCSANFADLQQTSKENDECVSQRRKKYFQSSAGYLSKR